MTVLGTRGTAWQPETRLYSDGVVVGNDGAPLVVPPHSHFQHISGTGYLDPGSGNLPGAYLPTRGEVDAAQDRLSAADVPSVDTGYAAMAMQALIDIDVLLFPNGAAVGAGSPYWRYVWPRDAGFMAAALMVTGRSTDAHRIISYVARVQGRDGTWQARYLPDESGRVPDDRGQQLDGLGWTLWATWLWAQKSGADVAPLRSMTSAATKAALSCLHPETHLPAASQDYWEMEIDEVTLGTAAPVLLALRCGAEIAAGIGDDDLANTATETATRMDKAIRTGFGSHGYQRRVSGTGGRDASVAFLLPPFAAMDDEVLDAWRAEVSATTVANGGVRPGEEWSDLVTAWTPQVSWHALAAAAVGDTALAHRLLSWLDVRRTRLGALPEKVTDAGRPAAVAPIGMVGALVLLTLYYLDGRALPMPGGAA